MRTLSILPPIMYPTTMLNVAVNYAEYAVEMGVRDAGAGSVPPGAATPGTTSAPGIWARRPDDTRWNPYQFLRTAASVIADGETIQLPIGREQIDWECELGVVIGRRALRVPVAEARNYIATGTPPGVGSARKPPVYLKSGDIVACTYEGIGASRRTPRCRHRRVSGERASSSTPARASPKHRLVCPPRADRPARSVLDGGRLVAGRKVDKTRKSPTS